MRKSLSYKQGWKHIRSWVRRLVLGMIVGYAASLGVMAMFRHYGGEPLMIVGFLTVFALLPVTVLVAFSLPPRRVTTLPARQMPLTTWLLPLVTLVSQFGTH
ncbi:hypothetical protein [Asaia bogorensis]